MGQARGYKSQIVIDYETTYGVNPGVPNGILLPINVWDVSGDKPLNKANTIRGNRNPVKPFYGNAKLGGNAEIPLDLVCFGYWLKAMFGAPTTTGAGPYTHVFKIGDTQPSLLVEKKFDFMSAQTYYQQHGIKIASAGFSFGGDGELLCNMSVVGAKEDAPTGTAYDATLLTPTFDRIYNDMAVISEGGSQSAVITECNFNIDFGLDATNYTIGGGGKLGDLPEGICGVNGNLVALFNDTALQTKALNGTESQLSIVLTSGANSLTISLPELVYAPKSPGITGPTGVRQALSFEGYYDNGAGASAAIITLVNGQASYA